MHKSKRFVLKRKTLFIRAAALVVPLICVLLLLSQTALAQNTYVITDGSRVVVHTTYASDPAAVLDEAGLELGADDTYTTQEGEGVSEITVRRSQSVRIDYCGEVLQAATYGETVESLLNRMNVPLGGDTAVSVPLDTMTYDGMELSVSRILTAVESYTLRIPYNTNRCYDPNLPVGTEVVLTQGESGQAVCTASVVYKNGVETSRTLLTQTVAQQPVDAVIAVGTNTDIAAKARQANAPVIGDGVIVTPTGEVLTYTGVVEMLATAYHCEGYVGTTAIGTVARVGAIAVDPSVIPYGTRMYIVSNDGEYVYGIATAEDCGGLIKGNRVDLFYDTEAECWQFGARDCQVYILG